MSTPTQPTKLNPEGKPFRFASLKVNGPDDSSTGSIFVVCCATKRRRHWNDAARAGWVADLNGKAYAAYYSPEGKAKVTA